MPLTQEEIDGCKDAFLAFDKDRSGSIDVCELRQVLEGTFMLLLLCGLGSPARLIPPQCGRFRASFRDEHARTIMNVRWTNHVKRKRGSVWVVVLDEREVEMEGLGAFCCCSAISLRISVLLFRQFDRFGFLVVRDASTTLFISFITPPSSC